MDKLGIVIVAAGKGTRMGTAESKQFLPLCGKPVLVHTLEAFERMDDVSSIVLVVGEQDIPRCREYVERYGLAKVKAVTAGGSERQSSVYKGLLALAGEADWVMVHDGVRPFISEKHVTLCWQVAKKHGAAVLAVPVKDTIKVVSDSGRIESTPDRRKLWAIQTPQAFRLTTLIDAHEQAERDGFLGTDDAMLMERLGIPVHVVEGSYTNFKITTPEDLKWSEFLLGLEEGGTRQ